MTHTAEQHTPEPWEAFRDGKRELNNVSHFINCWWIDEPTHWMPLPAAPAIASVNACAGLDTEELEEIGLRGIGDDQILGRAIEQRDELLVNLEQVTSELEYQDKERIRADRMGLLQTPPRVSRMIDKARAAIASVKIEKGGEV